MIGLSEDIRLGLDEVIKGLEYRFNEVDLLNPEKMQKIMKSKVSSFDVTKGMLMDWIASPNAPRKETLAQYLDNVINAGDKAVLTLRQALRKGINYEELDSDKHDAAIMAKGFLTTSILGMSKSLIELRKKREEGNFDFSEKEFGVSYPEWFGKGEMYPKKNYWKKWLEVAGKTDIVNIAPDSSKGEKIELFGLTIRLPKPPKDKSDILFSDLPKKEQYWRRQEFPENITPDNVEFFDDIIREEFRRRREGIWFMNNGKPVYLTGNHYFALQWCTMLDNGGFMDFRYAQLHMFYHLEACIVDKRCLGQIFLKSRRTGFTYVVLAILLNMATGTSNSKYGMTSKSGDDVQEAFDKFSYMFLSLPFFFRPVVKGKEDSPSELFFGKPSNNSKEAKKSRKTSLKDYLNTSVDHRPTKNDSYDSVKLNGYLGDECAKWKKPSDYVVHLGMVAPTMMPNGNVIGKAFLGSTMGARSKGGEQMIELINGSKIEDRDEVTQQTTTGLYFYFLPAQENMEQFTDKYGFCHTVKPPKGTFNVLGTEITMGSLDYLKAKEAQKRKQSDKALNEQLRTYPRTVAHALRDETDECVFNSTKINEQIDYNESIPEVSKYTVGNFRWKNGITDSDVEFFPDPKGRFKVSWIPSAVDGTESLKNGVKKVGDRYYPTNLNCVRFGCDPFSIAGVKGSKGGLHGKTMNLPEGGAPRNKFVVEYIARPSDETIFFEDVIKCVRFYGALILVESNRIDLLRHMRNRGYRAFAMNRLDKDENSLTDNEKKYGGQTMSGQSILDSHQNAIGYWIETQVGVYSNEELKIRKVGEMGDMPFEETLKDWLSFNPKKRTEFDATISSGLAIMACNEEHYKGKKVKPKRKHVKSMLRKYNNKGSVSSLIK